jgi:hypothetical protein
MLDGERQRRQQWAGGVALIPTLLPGADRLAKSCDHPESNDSHTSRAALPAEGACQTSIADPISGGAEGQASQANSLMQRTAGDASGAQMSATSFQALRNRGKLDSSTWTHRRLAQSGRNAAPRAGNSSDFIPRNRFADVRRRQIAGPSSRRMMWRASHSDAAPHPGRLLGGSTHASTCIRSG